jgi:hypothetical protein
MRVFVKAPPEMYGPRAMNATYTATAADGTRYHVTRHRWVMPLRWGWKAEPLNGSGKTHYGETLTDIALALRRLDEFEGVTS